MPPPAFLIACPDPEVILMRMGPFAWARGPTSLPAPRRRAPAASPQPPAAPAPDVGAPAVVAVVRVPDASPHAAGTKMGGPLPHARGLSGSWEGAALSLSASHGAYCG